MSETPYDAFLLLSFGGPEKEEDVMPFLRNVVRGRPVPDERLQGVAKHYLHFDGKSPINDQNRALLEALRKEFREHNVDLPIYWGNRNWHPMLGDTLGEMARDGVKRALVFATSAFSCFSGCKQYRNNMAAARESHGPDAPQLDKLRLFYNHPGFIEPMAESLRKEAGKVFQKSAKADELRIVFTAHSIPVSMAKACSYEVQLREACALVMGTSKVEASWDLVFQSRSGPPAMPWLEPDICDHLESLAHTQVKHVINVPIGFISDHMEVVWDLDHEAREKAIELGLEFHRAPTVGVHPRFVSMIRELVAERTSGAPRLAMGENGPWPDTCGGPNCCDYASGRPARS